MRKLIFGNWKMNGLGSDRSEFARMCEGGQAACLAKKSLLGVFPPATLLRSFAERASQAREGSRTVLVGGQTCHASAFGAFTGELSAEMLVESGARLVLVGHSERRRMGESDAEIAAKVRAAERAALVPVLCVGESLAEKERGETLSVLNAQLSLALPESSAEARVDSDLGCSVIVAYEPIWSIGSGRTPSLEELDRVDAHIRRTIEERGLGASVPVLYGGSVSPSNARRFLERMEGVLVGTNSLRAADFLAIAASAP